MKTVSRVASPTQVRRLAPSDADAVIRLDAKVSGRRREAYFRVKLREAFEETGIRVSLAAECDGIFAGFLLARLYYGEFGVVEPEAVLDTLGVDPDFQHRGIGSALLDQLRTNLAAVGIRRLATQVDWDSPGLLAFFHRRGFRPATRLCLETSLDPEHCGREPESEQVPEDVDEAD